MSKKKLAFLIVVNIIFVFTTLLFSAFGSSQALLDAKADDAFRRATMPARDAIVSRHIGGVIHHIATPEEVGSVRGDIEAIKAERAAEETERLAALAGGDDVLADEDTLTECPPLQTNALRVEVDACC